MGLTTLTFTQAIAVYGYIFTFTFTLIRFSQTFSLGFYSMSLTLEVIE